MVDEAWTTLPELDIPKEASLEAKIQKLAVGVRDARTRMAKV